MTSPQKRDAPSPKAGRNDPFPHPVQSPKTGHPYLPYPTAQHGAASEPAAVAAPSHQLRWDRANPKARWAHQALRSAINKGLIERGPCEVCGATHGEDGTVIHGHHDNYDMPIAVRWLCLRHHRQHHAQERRAARHNEPKGDDQ